MSKWPRVSLGELLTLERRPVKVFPDSYYEEIGIYCFGRGIFHKPPRSGLEVGEKDLFLIKSGDFILQITFAWEGAVAVASAAEDGVYGSVRFPTFRVNEGKCDPQYLLNYFRTHEGREQLIRICPGSAGRNRVLGIKRLPEVTLPLPALSEQRRIVAKIDELAAKMSEVQVLKESTLIETKKFWKVLSRIARGSACPIKTLGEMVEFLDGQRIPLSRSQRAGRGGHFPYYGASGIIDWIDDYIFDEPLLLLSEDGANLINRSTPIAFIATGKYWVNNHAHVLRPQPEVADMKFLEYALSDFDVSVFNFASAQAKLNQKNAAKIAFPLPSINEQQRIVAYLDRLKVKVEELEKLQEQTATELDSLLPSVLDKAFKGEL